MSNTEDVDAVAESLRVLIMSGAIVEQRGRCVFPGREALIMEHETREALFPRKLARARSVAYWLTRLSGVRFVALCNTTALCNARDNSDLDFFIIARAGTLWQVRLFAALPYIIGSSRPTERHGARDAICLSFFVDDTHLDLSDLQLVRDDVYFRHWFLSLLPLYDDGIGHNLWEANLLLRKRHPFARKWSVNPDLNCEPIGCGIPCVRMLESVARRLQLSQLHNRIRSCMNQNTDVVVNDHVLKFHVDDGRELYRRRFQETCLRYGLEP